MKGYIGVTDTNWAAHLRATGQTEANFWLPSNKQAFKVLKPGEPFLFKTHMPDNRIVGGGFFEYFTFLRVSEAWDFMQERNGVASLDAFVASIHKYRRDNSDLDPEIGCIILNDLVFFDDAMHLPSPESFKLNIVKGKGYVLDSPETDTDAERLFGLLLAASGPPLAADINYPLSVPGPVFGEGTVAKRRLGQGAFKALLMDSYDRRCAITGHKIWPTLQAAHIKPVSRGGENRVDNGLLLRSDVHTMFDRGYLTVDRQHQLRVSPRLRADFGNGEEFYARQGSVITLPAQEKNRPALEFLEWHGDEVFLAG